MANKKVASLNVGRSAGIIIAIVGALVLFLMLVTPTPRSTFIFTLFLISCSLITCFLSSRFAPAHITLTENAIQLRIRRSGETVTLPWTEFSCLYTLEGWKMKIYLLTPEPMDKEAQLAAYKACCKDKDVPYTHGGCLILNAFVHGDVIDQYLPSHIQRMPWRHCAKL